MCQLCIIKDIASRDRWPYKFANTQPKPLEPNVQEILAIIPMLHKEATNFNVRRDLLRKANSKPRAELENGNDTDAFKFASSSSTPEFLEMALTALIQTLAMLDVAFDLLSEARVEWWNSPAKKQQRREWYEACNTAKLTDLQKVNQKSIDMIADMSAVLGRFRRWNLDIVQPVETDGEMKSAQVDEETRPEYD